MGKRASVGYQFTAEGILEERPSNTIWKGAKSELEVSKGVFTVENSEFLSEKEVPVGEGAI